MHEVKKITHEEQLIYTNAVNKSPHPAFGRPLPEGEGVQEPLSF